jgi:hypothetical protein
MAEHIVLKAEIAHLVQIPVLEGLFGTGSSVGVAQSVARIESLIVALTALVEQLIADQPDKAAIAQATADLATHRTQLQAALAAAPKE